MDLAEQVRTRRTALGYTQVQFAGILGVACEKVAALERGTWPCVLASAAQQRLAQLLGCSVKALGFPSARRRRQEREQVARAGQSLGRHIAYWRVQRGLTQEALGALMHLHPTVICRWERNRVRPTPEMLTRLAEALACRVEELDPTRGPTRGSLHA